MMETTAVKSPPRVAPKPSPPIQQQLMQQQFAPQAQQIPTRAPLPGAVQVLPMMPHSQVDSAPKLAPRPPAFLQQIQGADINEGDR